MDPAKVEPLREARLRPYPCGPCNGGWQEPHSIAAVSRKRLPIPFFWSHKARVVMGLPKNDFPATWLEALSEGCEDERSLRRSGLPNPSLQQKRWANVLSTLAATGLYRCSGWQYTPQAPHSSPFANNFNSFLPFLLGETRLNSNQPSWHF
jgi:hypothetical protein